MLSSSGAFGVSAVAASAANRAGVTPDQHVRQQLREPRFELDGATVPACLGTLEFGEVGGGEFVGAVLQQPGEEEVARLQQRQVLLVLDVAGRQQPRRLEVEQRGRNEEELGGLSEIPIAGRREVGEELVGDLRQRHLGDVQLATADQAEQQVKRAFEVIESDVEAFGGIRNRALTRAGRRFSRQ